MAKELQYRLTLIGPKQAVTDIERLDNELRLLANTKRALVKDIKKVEAILGVESKEARELQKTLTDVNLKTQELRIEKSRFTKEVQAEVKVIKAVGTSYMELQAQTNRLVGQLKNLPDGFNATNTEAQRLREQIVANTERLKAFDQQIGQNFRNVGNYAESIKQAYRELQIKQQTLKQVEAELRKMRVGLNDARRQGGAAYSELSTKIKIAEQEQRRLTAEVQRLQPEVRSLSNSIKGLGGTLLRTAGTFGLFIGVATIFRSATRTFIDFEQGLADLAAISQASESEFEALKNQARELGSSTQFTATQVTELQLELAKLGTTVPDILTTTDSLLTFAKIARTELATAAEVAGITLNQFDLKASETARIVDVMTVAFSKSPLDIDRFKVSMEKVGPVASQFGFTLEDTTAMLGQLVAAGLDASTAGTSLRNIFLNLADPAGALAVELGRPIKSLDDLVPALNELQGRGIDVARALELTDRRSVAAFATLLKGADDVRELRDALLDSAGAAEKAGDTIEDTLLGDIKQSASAFEDLAIEIGQAVTPALRVLVSGITSLVRGIVTFQDVIVPFLAALVVWRVSMAAVTLQMAANTGAVVANSVAVRVARGGIMLLAFAKRLLTGQLFAATGAMRAFTAAVAANPIGLLLTGITALVLFLPRAARAMNRVSDEAKALAATSEELQKITNAVARSIASEKVELASLLATARNENLSKERRLDAIKAINRLSPEMLGNLTLEKLGTEEATAAIEAYIIQLEKKARAMAIEERLVELYKEQADLQTDLTKSAASSTQRFFNFLQGGMEAGNRNRRDALRNQAEGLAEVQTRIDALLNLHQKQIEQEEDANDVTEESVRLLRTRAEIQAQITKLQSALAQSVAGSSEEKQILADIAALQKRLNATQEALRESERAAEQRKRLEADLLRFTSGIEDARLELIEDARQREVAIIEAGAQQRAATLRAQAAELLENDLLTADERAKIEADLARGLAQINEGRIRQVLQANQTFRMAELAESEKRLEGERRLELLRAEQLRNDRLRAAGLLVDDERKLTKEQQQEKLAIEKDFNRERNRIAREGLEDLRQLFESELGELTASLEGDVANGILSDEEKAAIEARIQEIKTALSAIPEVIEGGEDTAGFDLLAALGIDEDGLQAIYEGINAVQAALDLLGAAREKQSSDALAEVDARYERERDRIERSIRDEGRRAEALLALDKKIEAEKKAISEEALKRQKQVQVAQAIIGAAQAQIQVWADPSLPLVAKVIAAVAVALSTAAQITKIKNQKLKRGGIIRAEGGTIPAGGGVAQGRSHETGGIKMGGYEIEGGEYTAPLPDGSMAVINKRSTSRFRGELDAIMGRLNEINTYGGWGRTLSHTGRADQGGILGPAYLPVRPVVTTNSSDVVDSFREFAEEVTAWQREIKVNYNVNEALRSNRRQEALETSRKWG